MPETIYPVHVDDLILWPCGTTCYAHELESYSHKSDDYERISVHSPRYSQVLEDA